MAIIKSARKLNQYWKLKIYIHLFKRKEKKIEKEMKENQNHGVNF